MNDPANTQDPTQSLPPRFNFGLRQMFYAIALIAAGMAIDPITIGLSFFVLLIWWACFYATDPKATFFKIILPLLVLAILIGMLMPQVQVVKESPPQSQCLNNLRQMMLATHSYESANGHFPTDQIVVLEDGTELRHSWRIELLPYLEYQTLYDQYDFNEPWDGPNNSKLKFQMPLFYSCPSHSSKYKTVYKMVNGPGTAFEAGKKNSFEDISDDTSNTIGIIEDHANPVDWMEPLEFTADQSAQAMNGITKATSAHTYETKFFKNYYGCNFALMDCSTYSWPPQADRQITQNAFLIADGEVINLSTGSQSLREIKYLAFIAPIAYLLLILLPFFYLGNRTAKQSGG